ncbi:GAF and ANTAR domain-containing protein [Mycolicibacterium grossiae]|nr:GAF and ANTAR domain-containing protein [Mycolicibacterium grossiae]QEM43769.1 GAF and ANTAR domain-containing protein [Mycolicibacterium grossiae]
MSSSRDDSTQTPRTLVRTLGDLAVQMRGLRDPQAVLAAIVAATVDTVPGSSWAGLAVVSRRKIRPAVPTDDVAARLDQLQTDLGEGPALSALHDRQTVHIDDLAADERWPRFSTVAVRLGVRSMLSYRLYITNETLGVLNIYAAESGAFSEDAVATGEVLAQHAAVAMAGAVAEEQLQNAVANRDVIGQAKGILMQRDRLTGLQAFTVLTRASQETNVRLVDVAKTLVADHEAALTAATP